MDRNDARGLGGNLGGGLGGFYGSGGSGGSVGSGGSFGTGGTNVTGVGGRLGTGGTAGTVGVGGAAGRVGVGGMIGAGGTNGAGGIGGSVVPGLGGVTGTGGSVVSGAGGMTVVLTPASLTGSTSHDFGNLAVNVVSVTAFTWTIRNTGGMPSGTLSLTNDDPAELGIVNNCPAMLAGGGSCTVVVTFKSTGLGNRTAGMTMSASPGGSVTLSMTANGQNQVTVTVTGTGVVTSVPAGIRCPGTCSAAFSDATVTLQARTTNGSGAFFSGWTGGLCTGPFRDCTVTITKTGATAGATFSPMTANLAFITSQQFRPNMGGVAPYDTACNTVASAAGINDGTGTAYVALVSETTSDAMSRLTGARGWVTLDNKPFADTPSALFGSNQVFNAVRFNETGLDAGNYSFMTGTDVTGTVVPQGNCSDWSGVGQSQSGYAYGGPFAWVRLLTSDCVTPSSLLCLGKSKMVTVTPPPATTGRKVWLSNVGYIPNATTTPDARCQTDRPTGVNTGVALISTTTTAASTVLSPTMSYYRPDGVFVGLGADIATGRALPSGIWQSGDGMYRRVTSDWIWTGSTAPNLAGTTMAGTCGNWTDPTQTAGLLGASSQIGPNWWNGPGNQITCSLPLLLYCVQTVP